jgi:hypothetical protein
VVNNENYKEVDNLFPNAISIPQSELFDRLGSWKGGATGDKLYNLYKALETRLPSLGQVIDKPQVGIKTGSNGCYIFKNSLIPDELEHSELLKDYVIGREVKRYGPIFPQQKILFPYKNSDSGLKLINEGSSYKKEFEYLNGKKDILVKRAIIDQGVLNGTKSWYEYQQLKSDFPFQGEYIIYPDISSRANFTLARAVYYDMTCFGIPSNSKSLLAILNSRLIETYLNTICVKARGGYLRLKSQYMLRIPLAIEFENEGLAEAASQILLLQNNKAVLEKSLCDLLLAKYSSISISAKIENWPSLDFKGFLAELKKAKVVLGLEEEAEWMVYFNKKKAEANALQSEIDRIDKEIDQMVYALYELSPEEIEIVENS